MNEVITRLEKIARLAKGSTADAEIFTAIQEAENFVRKNQGVNSSSEAFARLAEELAVWRLKLSAILKEPVGRQGMAKHALHWAEELKKLHH